MYIFGKVMTKIWLTEAQLAEVKSCFPTNSLYQGHLMNSCYSKYYGINGTTQGRPLQSNMII